MPASAAISLQNVCFSYNQQGQPPVLQDVNITVEQGEFLAVVGPNGGGKTTLLKLLLALLHPRQGQIQILGCAPAKARRMMGYLPQQVNLDPAFPASILDLVLMGALGAGLTRAQKRSRACRALQLVGLRGMEHHNMAELSGGQKQKALIARALAANPQILCLDEPAASLDPRAELDLFDLLAALNRTGLTILVVSHDLSFVSPYVERVVCVNRAVEIHPAGEMAADTVSHLYGKPMRRILHDIKAG
jgi:zinc transport system ATP-binding protein